MDFVIFHVILLFNGFVFLDAVPFLHFVDDVKRESDVNCDDVAQALKTWLEAWSEREDYQPELRTPVLDHLSNVLHVDFKNFDDLHSFACKLVAANDYNEIQDVLQVPTAVMSFIQDWAQAYSTGFGDGNGAVQWLHSMHKLDNALRNLGYPSVPLTASKADVEKFILDLYSETKNYPFFQELIAPGVFEPAALVDVLTGSQTIDDAAEQYNIDKYELSYAYSLVIYIGESADQAGWSVIEANLRGYDALWKAGIIDKLLPN